MIENIIKSVVDRFPAVLPFLSRRARYKASTADTNREYHDEITSALVDYFEGGSLPASRNQFKRAMVAAFLDIFEAGWQDGGAELPLDDEALNWLGDRQSQEMVNIDSLFQNARDIRKQKDFDYFAWSSARADGYVSALQGVYNAASMLAKGKQMLTWHLGQTEQHCDTCASLNGKKHPAYWYIERNYIPRQAGAAMDCGGYNCDCRLEDRDGNEVTL